MATRKKSANEAAAEPEKAAASMPETPAETADAAVSKPKTPSKTKKAAAAEPETAAVEPEKAAVEPEKAPAKAKKTAAKARKAPVEPVADEAPVTDEAPVDEDAPAADEDAPVPDEDTAAEADPPARPAPRTPYVAPMAPLPDAFGTDRAVIMARDPESAFIYWEVTADGVGRARAALGDTAAHARLTLRIYVGEGAAARFEDHAVSDWLGRFTYFAPKPGLRLAASVGYLAENVFVHVTQSLPARLPRRGPGNDPVRFVRVGPRRLTPPQAATAPDVAGVPAGPGGAPSGGPGTAASPAQTGGGAPAGSHHLVPNPENRR
jgi:hypothetical protein